MGEAPIPLLLSPRPFQPPLAATAPPLAARARGRAQELKKEYEKMKKSNTATKSTADTSKQQLAALTEQVAALQTAFDTVSDVVCDECDKVRASTRGAYDELRRQTRQLAHAHKVGLKALDDRFKEHCARQAARDEAADAAARDLLERVHLAERDVGVLKVSYSNAVEWLHRVQARKLSTPRGCRRRRRVRV